MIFFALLVALALTTSASAEKKIVCYHGNWASYRPAPGKFDIEDINPNLCTHLIYSFVGVDGDDIKIFESWLDIDKNGYGRFNALRNKNPNLKTLVAVGGWTEGSSRFSKMASSARSRANFVKNAVDFIKKHKFDGLDVDWEYPAQREGSSPADVQNFVLLLKDLRTAFNKENLILSAAVGATEYSASKSYDIAQMAKYLHFINVMAYDMHGQWDKKTGLHAAQHAASSESGTEAMKNVDAVVKYWLSKGASREQLILGIPLYGRSFTINPGQTAVNSPASGPGQPGPYTKEEGFLGYNEICEMQKGGGWTTKFDDERRMVYTYKGDQWTSYDNPTTVKEKAEFIEKEGLGGAMVWSIETDDFRGKCGDKYPLLKTLNHVLRNGPPLEQQQPLDDPIVFPEEVPNMPSMPENPRENPENNKNDAECKAVGIIADPKNQKQYYQCVANTDGSFIKYSMPCSEGLIFNPDIGVCDYPKMK